MKQKSEYSKPRMEMEQFTPQEYVAACWWVQLVCTGGSGSGNHWLFNTSTPPTNGSTHAVGEVTHPGHEMIILKAVTPDDNPPQGEILDNALACVGEFPAALLDDSNTNGNPSNRAWHLTNGIYEIGYAWQIDGEYHFHEGELVWERQTKPNAIS